MYQLLLVKLYRFLSRRTDAPFNQLVLKRLFLSKINRPPVSTSKLNRNFKQGQTMVVVGKVLHDERVLSENMQEMKVCALSFGENARGCIEKAGGKCITFDQLALQSPLGENCTLLRGAVKARETCRFWGAPGVPGSSTKPHVRSRGGSSNGIRGSNRKNERARGRRKSRGFKV